IYGFILDQRAPAGDLPYRDILRTRHIDPHGNTTSFRWGTDLTDSPILYRVNAVADSDGHTNLLGYSASNGRQLIGVTNFYGLNVGFGYDSKGNLNRLTDAATMTSTVNYDTNGYPQALMTPYGTNTFAYTFL